MITNKILLSSYDDIENIDKDIKRKEQPKEFVHYFKKPDERILREKLMHEFKKLRKK
jgi:hypothetical protein